MEADLWTRSDNPCAVAAPLPPTWPNPSRKMSRYSSLDSTFPMAWLVIGKNALQWRHFYDLVLRDYDWRFSFFFFSPYFFDGPTDICLPRQNIISKQDVSIQYIEDGLDWFG